MSSVSVLESLTHKAVVEEWRSIATTDGTTPREVRERCRAERVCE